ncbi:MAG TPA: 3-dehydroquinate synthase family protein, partial [Bacteroidia bacterium]|nr:3-dehydroquinate synthase family protein [Bacteroidia bacterium]
MTLIKSGGYQITIGKKALNGLSAFLAKNRYSSFYILCDENTLQCCLPTLVISCKALAQAQVIEIESGESSKSMEFCAQVLQTLAENGADKKALLINLGGGVVSDLGGFSASVYKRGIHFINIPTTLLAMADASVGGKTGIDFAGVKNLVGTFAQPRAVFIYPDFLKTLPQRHVVNGFAEIYKIALVSDSKFWNELK